MEEYSQLVVLARAGNADAYADLVARFQDMAYHTAYRYLGDHHQAQDAVQEALLETYIHLHQLQEPAAFPGWFRQIVFRQCTRVLRRASLKSVSLATLALETECQITQPCTRQQALEHLVEEHELRLDVRQAIQALPAQEREVTALFYFSQYSQDEMSSLLNLPVTTIKKRLYSARQRLKKQLQALVNESAAINHMPPRAKGRICDMGAGAHDGAGAISQARWAQVMGILRMARRVRRYYRVKVSFR